MNLSYGPEYEDFKKEVQIFCSKYSGINFSDTSKVPLAGTFKSDGPTMTRSKWQKTLIDKGYMYCCRGRYFLCWC